MRIHPPGQPPLDLPEDLLRNLRAVHGNLVDDWLRGLPDMLANLLRELDARIVPGEPPLSYHLVFFARRSNGEDIVVKCTVPNPEQPPEVAAVHGLSDSGIGPRLVWSDLEGGAFVMERVRPGTMLTRSMPTLLDDAKITHTMATLAKRMAGIALAESWCDDLVNVRQYTRALGTVDTATELWATHREEIERALELREDMLGSPDQPHGFLHGDLQHHNVLHDDRAGLRVIDPKGLVGPAGYEFGALTYNPPGIQHHPDFAAIERQRVDIWSEVTGLPWETVRSWGYVAAVLSACWSAIGGQVPWRDAMLVARTLDSLQPPGER